MRWMNLGGMRETARASDLWREGQRLVTGYDPDTDDPRFLALLFRSGILGIRHRRKGADRDRNLDGVGTNRRAFPEDAVTFHRAEVAVGSPIGEKVLHFIARLGFPEFVGGCGIAGHQRIEEMLHGSFFGIEAKGPPEARDRDQDECRNRESNWP
jgi:hypothetical protein